MSPSRRSLRRMSSSLCRVARSTVTPPTSTGSSSAQGLSTPVRPTLMWILTQPGLRGGGSELVGHGPARVAAHGAQGRLQPAVVELDHHAVDVVVELVPPLLPLAGSRRRSRPRVPAARVSGLTRKPALAQPRQHLLMAGELPSLHVAHPVEPGGERPRRGHPRIQLAQRARGRVARVGEGGLARRHALLVQLLEGGQRQVDLAPHLDHRREGGRRRPAWPAAPSRWCGGWRSRPRPPRRCPAWPPPSGDRPRSAATRPGRRSWARARSAAAAGSQPASADSFTTRACQARSSSSFLAFASESMGSPWRTWLKAGQWLAAHPLGGRVGGDQFGMSRLQVLRARGRARRTRRRRSRGCRGRSSGTRDGG